MSKVNFCIDEVIVSADVEVDDDTGEFQIELLEVYPDGIYTERELKLLVKKELHQLIEEHKLEMLLNQLEEKNE